MTDGHFKRHLEAALAAVGAEVPDLHRAAATALGGRVVTAEVDGERVEIVGEGEAIAVREAVAEPAVSARTSRTTICEILAGRCTVLEALRSDALDLRGRIEDLLALEYALQLFVQGAVRAPSLPGILVSYRGGVRST